MSSALALAARMVLAAVFALSGTRKLGARAEAAAALAGLGVPAAGAAGTALPVAELALAAALAGLRHDVWPSAVAIAVLGAFTTVVVANLARGNAAPCPCFGSARPQPVSTATVARNGWLLALGVMGTGSSAGAGWAATAALTAALGAVTVAAVRRSG